MALIATATDAAGSMRLFFDLQPSDKLDDARRIERAIELALRIQAMPLPQAA